MDKIPTAPDGWRYTYTVCHEAWYAKAQPDQRREVIVSRSDPDDGGVAWEFGIREHTFSNEHTAVRADLFDDAWDAFTEVPSLFAVLAESGRGTRLEDVIEILGEIGFVDATERATPQRYRRPEPVRVGPDAGEALRIAAVHGDFSKFDQDDAKAVWQSLHDAGLLNVPEEG